MTIKNSYNLLRFFFFMLALTSALPRVKSLNESETAMNSSMLSILMEGFFSEQAIIMATPEAKSDVCQSTRMLGNNALGFTCTNEAMRYYSNNPDNYAAKVNEIHTVLTQVSQQHAAVCKLDRVQKDPRFHVELAMQSDLANHRSQARYDASTLAMRIPINTADTPVNARLMHFLIHLSFTANQNLFFKRSNYDASKKIAGLSPAENDAEKFMWQAALINGCTTIFRLYSLLNAKIDTLGHDSRILLEKFNEASAEYQPYHHTDIFQQKEELHILQQYGFVDDHYKVVKEGFYLPTEYTVPNMVGLPVPYLKAKKFVFTGEKTTEGYVIKSRSVEDPSDVRRAALLDPVIKISEAFRGDISTGTNHMITIDSYIHELFAPYPRLFELLFPRLLSYHLERSDSAYQACIKMGRNAM